MDACGTVEMCGYYHRCYHQNIMLWPRSLPNNILVFSKQNITKKSKLQRWQQ